MGFVANFLRFPAAQKFWKSVKIWQSYRQLKGGNFFETQCRIVESSLMLVALNNYILKTLHKQTRHYGGPLVPVCHASYFFILGSRLCNSGFRVWKSGSRLSESGSRDKKITRVALMGHSRAPTLSTLFLLSTVLLSTVLTLLLVCFVHLCSYYCTFLSLNFSRRCDMSDVRDLRVFCLIY